MYSVLPAGHYSKTSETDVKESRKSQGMKDWQKKHRMQKTKGIKKCVVKRELQHNNFLECLRTKKLTRHDMYGLHSYDHEIYLEQVNKIGLNPYDNKRWILLDEENTKRDARVEELEQKNIELETRLAILEQGEKGISTKDVSQSPVDSNNTQASNIPDNTSNSSITPERIENSSDITSDDAKHRTSNSSDTYQEKNSRSSTERIRENNREKKLQVQNLSSNNNSLALKERLSESCDIKKIPNTSLPVEDLDDSDEIELIKNQNIELDLIRDLRNDMFITLSDPIEIPSKDIVDNEKPISIESS
ncbi:1813_t:CDS:2 [Acaulospora morrowiae]|uniref:1813_t:CDS:1 n=1 Tax=Acaulospora morrowiae TaxID=94023 RepID=A0A9N8VFV8_9GLOM|nr:1813_t:CDS:2 [Acaulospora morrowiae]